MHNGPEALKVTSKMVLPHSSHAMRITEYWYHSNTGATRTDIMRMWGSYTGDRNTVYWALIPSTGIGNTVLPLTPALTSYVRPCYSGDHRVQVPLQYQYRYHTWLARHAIPAITNRRPERVFLSLQVEQQGRRSAIRRGTRSGGQGVLQPGQTGA